MIIPLAEAQAGDAIFCHSTGIVSRAIRWGTHGEYNHVGWLDRQVGNEWYVGQAEGHGVTDDKTLESIAPGGTFVIVRIPDGVDRAKVLEFLRAQVGDEYGFLTIASIIVTLKTPEFFDVMAPGTWICSAVYGEGLRFGGWYHSWGDIYTVKPQPLFDALEAA